MIALCCEYEEANAAEIIASYDIDISDDSDEDEKIAAVVAYLEDRTIVVGETEVQTILFVQF